MLKTLSVLATFAASLVLLTAPAQAAVAPATEAPIESVITVTEDSITSYVG